MSELIHEVFLTVAPYLFVWHQIFLCPYFLGKAFWKLGLRGNLKNFKTMYTGLLFLHIFAYSFAFLIKAYIWSCKI